VTRLGVTKNEVKMRRSRSLHFDMRGKFPRRIDALEEATNDCRGLAAIAPITLVASAYLCAAIASR
jgi:hypothetical protein